MQSKRWSLIEAVANVLVGLGISLASQLVIFGAYGVELSMNQHVQIVLWFTVISIARSYFLRRIFNRIRR